MMRLHPSKPGLTMFALAWARPQVEEVAAGRIRWPGYVHLHLGWWWLEWEWR